MDTRVDGEERQLVSRRQGALFVLLPVLVVLLLLSGAAGYVAVSNQPLRVGSYAVIGPRCPTNFLWVATARTRTGGTVSTTVFGRPFHTQTPTWMLAAGSGRPIYGRVRWRFWGVTVIGP
jgi:hypothetical protein